MYILLQLFTVKYAVKVTAVHNHFNAFSRFLLDDLKIEIDMNLKIDVHLQ